MGKKRRKNDTDGGGRCLLYREAETAVPNAEDHLPIIWKSLQVGGELTTLRRGRNWDVEEIERKRDKGK